MIIGIYKPKGPTSHDMIYWVRRVTGVKRVGHAGTLDPAASGVLVVGIGRESTKQLGTIVEHDKEYVATVRLGMTSNTGDGEGVITEDRSQKIEVERSDVNEVVRTFVGEVIQVPPIYSAIKMGGKKAYDMARQGKEIVMEPRKVLIHSIEVVAFSWPDLVIKVHCGKGVYIRSLARDIGEALGVGGYMAELERTRVGEFTLDKCMTVDQLKDFRVEEAGEG